MKNEEIQSKGRGNPGGSQSGGKKKDETQEQLREQSQQQKKKRKDSEGNYVKNRNYKNSSSENRGDV
ncbi:hypothetical protein RM549_17765 [Salegentibacter sp. F188]|jgi:hypothetical protein|uniref:Uncharacterized protein n=1 Tax=Autumnicola patrickiae TaxID=3075591 RepID=A0ABU3E6N7_9FLAO|nr:hypothetical protein [Salegentibacter sp. F188]MDT0691644.1 hypothetical protein [Salegentibacter sp. F188]